MGFRLSRLAQAVIALTLCSASVQAAEQSDDLYKIKGPDNSVKQPAQIQPYQAETNTLQHGASGTKQAKPFVPDNNDRYAITANTKNYGPVRPTDTAWSISDSIRRLYPGANLDTPQVLRALYRKNPRAFGGRQLGNLMAGVRLVIPSLAEIKAAQAVAPKTTVSPSPQQTVSKQPTAKPEVTIPVVSAPVSSAVPAIPEVTKTEVIATTTVSASEPTQLMATTEETKPVAEVQQQDKPVVASTDLGLIDPKVHELVASTDTPVAAPVVSPLQEEIKVVQSENDELKTHIQELNTQISALQAKTQNQDALNAQIDDLQNKIKELENQNKTTVATTPKKAEDDSEHGILTTPLNLLLLISLPVLAVLLLSFWLRARSKREVAIKEQEMTETPAIAMDDSNSTFDVLIPDLNAAEDHHYPHEIDLSIPDLNEVENAVTEPETKTVELIDELPDLNMLDEETHFAAFDIEKLRGRVGVQMADQIVSEPEGWELPEEEIQTLNPVSETHVSLESIQDDEDKDWTKQFEPDDSSTEYVSIYKLLADTDASDIDPDELKANLNVRLDEFPDMLSEQNGVDIDEDGSFGAKLDLARAYLELDDKESAKELLIEVTGQGSSVQIKEAEKLLSQIG